MSVNEPVPASIATLLVANGKLLLGKRLKNNVFEGWQCPGGYLLQGETPDIAAKRICMQKAGLIISDIQQGPYTNNLFSDYSPLKHSVTLYVLARQYHVINRDVFESKQGNWCWYELDKLPESLFLPLKILIEQHNLTQLIQV